jgi:hypothetical protein
VPASLTVASWVIEPSPNPAGVVASQLDVVSCPAPGRCVAVGSAYPSSVVQHALIEQLSGGKWTIMSDPAVAKATDSPLAGVSCRAAGFCAAVGYARGQSGQRLHVGRRGGSADPGRSGGVLEREQVGAARHSAPVHRPANSLSGVSCAGGASCVPVGVASRALQSANQTMAEVWNGTSWSQSPSVNLPGRTTGLLAVSCLAPAACVAVGSSAANGSGKTLVEAYSG